MKDSDKNSELEDKEFQDADLLGNVCEGLDGKLHGYEGKSKGQFYSPHKVVELLVELLGPDKGRVYDPSCGCGGLLMQCQKFVYEHTGKTDGISIYGQESDEAVWQICRKSFDRFGLDAGQIKWNDQGAFLKDVHPSLQADFILANLPFNLRNWGREQLRDDERWQFGVPPASNANFAWLQHIIYHLSPTGRAGVLMAKNTLTSKKGGEGEIRRELIEKGWVDCIVNFPDKLFRNTSVPSVLWLISRKQDEGKSGDKNREILFIDARDLGHLESRRYRILSEGDIRKIIDVYYSWHNDDGTYKDIPGFCSSIPVCQIAEMDYVLAPGYYIGLPEEEDFNFEKQFNSLKVEFDEQLKEEIRLNGLIRENLALIDQT